MDMKKLPIVRIDGPVKIYSVNYVLTKGIEEYICVVETNGYAKHRDEKGRIDFCGRIGSVAFLSRLEAIERAMHLIDNKICAIDREKTRLKSALTDYQDELKRINSEVYNR
jgi:hypothetical protein